MRTDPPRPHEIGSQVGARWARLMHAQRTAIRLHGEYVDPVEVVAQGEIPQAVQDLVVKACERAGIEILPPVGLQAEGHAFWAGFVLGARSFLTEPSLGMGSN